MSDGKETAFKLRATPYVAPLNYSLTSQNDEVITSTMGIEARLGNNNSGYSLGADFGIGAGPHVNYQPGPEQLKSNGFWGANLGAYVRLRGPFALGVNGGARGNTNDIYATLGGVGVVLLQNNGRKTFEAGVGVGSMQSIDGNQYFGSEVSIKWYLF